ncbi:MAG TPA: outer membrane lipoprotein LolB [Usitatibacter sp.]|jgi:outer membrane biogenesis lipoprotein LolB|nr:outer membrane lipoprotein LolB [Usitatibacter sp.]
MIRLAAAAGAALLVSACAMLAPPEAPLPSLTTVPRAFEMSGRIAIRHGQSSDIAQLRWTRHAGSDTWVIASPLGNEVARIESTPSGATLTRADGAAEHAASFADLTREALGVSLDPASLAEALHGQTPRDVPEGWRFEIDETQASGPVRLAKRITVRGGDTVVRLVVDGYQPLPD